MTGPRRRPRILVIGFPKSGTSTIDRALRESGLVTAHWRWRGRPVGQLIYEGWFEGGDPFARLAGVDAVTQMDFCQPRREGSYWPNLDIALLIAIRELHPECRLILNARKVEATSASMARWHDFTERLTQADITGLPAGRGADDGERAIWIEAHHAALRRVFRDDPLFLDLDIAAPEAPGRLAAFIGRDLPWWGVENANPGI